eukprot:6376682-Pyramimonas_sp.AAC.1
MLYRTELFDAFILVQCNIAVPILCVPRRKIGRCTFVEFALAGSAPDALGALVNGVLSAGRIHIIDMFGCEQVTARLELFVVGRGSETAASRGPSELQ